MRQRRYSSSANSIKSLIPTPNALQILSSVLRLICSHLSWNTALIVLYCNPVCLANSDCFMRRSPNIRERCVFIAILHSPFMFCCCILYHKWQRKYNFFSFFTWHIAGFMLYFTQQTTPKGVVTRKAAKDYPKKSG